MQENCTDYGSMIKESKKTNQISDWNSMRLCYDRIPYQLQVIK